jgi:hypothetical protein
MAQQRLPMRKIRDVLRLSAAGLSKRQIAASLGIGSTAAGVRGGLRRSCVRPAELPQFTLIDRFTFKNYFWLVLTHRQPDYDLLIVGSEKMVIEIIVFLVFVVAIGAVIIKAYERRQDVLYGPYVGRRSERNR